MDRNDSAKYVEMLGAKSVIREISAVANAKAAEIGAENVFDYSLGNPSVPSPQCVNETLKRLIDETDPLVLHGYSESHGIAEVRDKVAESLSRRFGLEYKRDNIFMTSGAAGAIAHAVRAVSVPGDEIITFAPCFPEYYLYINETGAVLKVVPPNLDTFQINFEAFEEMLNPKVAAVLINTPNNPSGVLYSEETLRKLAEVVKRKSAEYGHDIYIISDEPYREIVFDGKVCPCMSQIYENTIMCYSFSKSLSLPGERIGYVATNPRCKDGELIVHMCTQISRGIGHNCPSSLMQLLIGEVKDETSDLRVYEANRNVLYEELTKLGFEIVKPDGTFYMLPKALEEDAVAFCKKALEFNLALVPGDSFGAPGYFRMSYCMPTEKVIRSLEAFKQLAAAYRK